VAAPMPRLPPVTRKTFDISLLPCGFAKTAIFYLARRVGCLHRIAYNFQNPAIRPV